MVSLLDTDPHHWLPRARGESTAQCNAHHLATISAILTGYLDPDKLLSEDLECVAVQDAVMAVRELEKLRDAQRNAMGVDVAAIANAIAWQATGIPPKQETIDRIESILTKHLCVPPGKEQP